ncbi:rhamnosyltransferase WsaF family glycosyltransferase [Agrobacterium rosae]
MKRINKKNFLFRKSNLINELFDPQFYIAEYPDLAALGNPFLHYKRYGYRELRSPNPFFDPQWYRAKNPDIDPTVQDLVGHYFLVGEREGRWPHPLFSPRWYTDAHPDVAENGMSPLLHFLRYGLAEGREFSPFFSVEWYKNRYSGLFSDNKHPALFFLIDPTGRTTDPGINFSSSWYLADNPDVRAAGVHPYIHYLKHGRDEGRLPIPYVTGPQKDKVVSGLELGSYMSVLSDEDVEPSHQSSVSIDIDTKKAKLVSFDVWSTLLHRNCYPDEIKLQSARFLLLNAYSDIKNAYRSVNELFWARIQCENRSAPNGDFEYRFEQAIPLWLSEVLAPGLTQGRISALADSLLDHEFRAEARSTYKDASTSLFAYNLETPKVFVSDFYMSAEFISRLLIQHGAGGIWTKGYSSSDHFINKRGGALFGKVMSDFAISPNDVLHIGDNHVADDDVPRKIGIRTYLYDSPADTSRMNWYRSAFESFLAYDPSLHERRLLAKVEAIAQQRESDYSSREDLHESGVRISPVVFYFVLSVIEDALKNGDKKIYFFTREGIFFKQVYDEIVKADPFNCSYPEARVLSVSRRATFAASLKGLSVSELMKLWSMYSVQSLHALVVSLNLDLAVVERIGRKFDLPFKRSIVHPWLDRSFLKFLKDPELIEHAEGRIADQKKDLLSYLEQEGVLSEDRLAIVDIGWRGTIQDNLSSLLNKPIKGHYLALFSFLNKQPVHSSKIGWLADHNDKSTPRLPDQVAPLEMIYNGAGGSVTGYGTDSDGQVVPLKQVISSEEEVISETSYLQKGMLAAIPELSAYVRLHGLTSADLKSLARSITLKLLEAPPSSIADLFAKLVHNESFGTGEAASVGEAADIEDLNGNSKHSEIHATLNSWLSKSRWPEGAVAASEFQDWWSKADQKIQRAAPLAIARLCDPAIGKAGGSKFNVYVPAVLRASGGHRTIFNMARRLADAGFQINIYSDGIGAGLNVVEEYLAGASARLHSTWDHSSTAEAAFATIAHSAKFVAQTVDAKHKFYLVQDAEALFNPVGDAYVEAENSYAQGLKHVTVGNWLSHVIRNQYNGIAEPAGLGVDTNIYRLTTGTTRENALCMLFQPEKPRRGNAIAIKALEILKESMPNLSIYLYGSDQNVALPFEAHQLGLITDLNELNALYNKCRVGLCLSLSNPSRIPFEVTASGCLPVDVYRYNNLMDYETGTAILAYQSPQSIALAIEAGLERHRSIPNLSERLNRSVAARTLEWEVDLMVSHVISGIEGRRPNVFDVGLSYLEPPIIADGADQTAAEFFCNWQRKLAEGV